MSKLAELWSSTATFARRHWLAFANVAGVASICLFLYLVIAQRNDVLTPTDPDEVAVNWQHALASLGIVGVFPPTEDLNVGDLFAVEYEQTESILKERSIHLAYVQIVGTVLADFYRGHIRLPPTPNEFDGHAIVENREGIFKQPDNLLSLPIVAFPGVSVSTQTAESAIGILSWLSTHLGYSSAASDSVQIKIPAAETFGLPGSYATGILDDYCNPEKGKIRPLCTEAYMRRELSSIDYHKRYLHGKPENFTPGKDGIEHGIYLRFIRRLYLARSIDYVFGTNTTMAAQARERRAAGGTTTSEMDSSSSAVQASNGKRESQPVAKASSDDFGNGLVLRGQTSSGVTFTLPFARPLVIGYESISALPFKPR